MEKYINDLDQELFDKIHFTERFAEISRRYPVEPKDDLLTILDFDLTKEILESFGYKVRYFRSEDFFRISEKREGYDFFFHVSFDNGHTELVWAVFQQKQLIRDVSDTWTIAYRKLAGCKWEDTPRYPCFHDYDEMEEMLKECFELWEDFKREFLAKHK